MLNIKMFKHTQMPTVVSTNGPQQRGRLFMFLPYIFLTPLETIAEITYKRLTYFKWKT